MESIYTNLTISGIYTERVDDYLLYKLGSTDLDDDLLKKIDHVFEVLKETGCFDNLCFAVVNSWTELKEPFLKLLQYGDLGDKYILTICLKAI